jgi:hypothetical protein
MIDEDLNDTPLQINMSVQLENPESRRCVYLCNIYEHRTNVVKITNIY